MICSMSCARTAGWSSGCNTEAQVQTSNVDNHQGVVAGERQDRVFQFNTKIGQGQF